MRIEAKKVNSLIEPVLSEDTVEMIMDIYWNVVKTIAGFIKTKTKNNNK